MNTIVEPVREDYLAYLEEWKQQIDKTEAALIEQKQQYGILMRDFQRMWKPEARCARAYCPGKAECMRPDNCGVFT